MNTRLVRSSILLLSLAGALVLLFHFSRFDVSPTFWRPSLNRAQAIASTRTLATSLGLDISNWKFDATARVNRDFREVRRTGIKARALELFSPLDVEVAARRPDGTAQLSVTLTAAGRPVSYKLTRARRGPPGADPNHSALAQNALTLFAGTANPSFRPTAASVKTRDGLHSAWEWADPGAKGIVARFEITSRDGLVESASLSYNVPERLLEAVREDPGHTGVFKVTVVVLLCLAACLLAVAFTFLRWARRKDHIHFALRFCAASLPLLALRWLSTYGQDVGLKVRIGDGPGDPGSLVSLVVLGTLILLVWFFFAAAGYALLPASERRHWVGLTLFTRARLFSRPVVFEAALGLAAGPALAAIPYLVARLWPTPPSVEMLEPAFLFAAFPLAAPFAGILLSWEILPVFLFVLPFLFTFVRQSWLRGSALALCGILFAAAFREPIPRALAPNLLACALAFGLLWLLYRSSGILAVWAAPLGSWTVWQAATFLASPSAFLSGTRNPGWSLLAMLLTLAAAAAATLLLAKPVDTEEIEATMEPGEDALSRSERDRLHAEFAVARRAQQDLLPANPPELDGFTLAASCEPAREVGGDLYEFFRFSNGRWALCVADVSGKGVPAALYMTLTKGLLAAARHHSADLAVIASRLNRFLGETGKRRTFVTMSLAELDAPSRRLRHVRAGHNPPLLYRAATRTSSFLMPKGIGLGITTPAAFDRNLEVEEFSLEPGDTLVLYSDGLTECMNPVQDQFGEDRLRETVHHHAGLDAAALQDRILDAVRQFRGTADPHDDLTVVVLRANPLT